MTHAKLLFLPDSIGETLYDVRHGQACCPVVASHAADQVDVFLYLREVGSILAGAPKGLKHE